MTGEHPINPETMGVPEEHVIAEEPTVKDQAPIAREEFESNDVVPESEDHKPVDALIVFGAGIRSDQELDKLGFQSPDEFESADAGLTSRLRLPMAAKLRTVAAAEFYLQGQTGDVIFTGGKVKEGEGVEQSEAQLMKDYFEKIVCKRWAAELKKEGKEPEEIRSIVEERWAQTEPHILLEDKATNTIENFAYTVNFLDRNKSKYRNIALLSNEFHMDRIMQLAEMLRVQGERVSAEPTTAGKRPHYGRFVRNYFDLEGNTAYRKRILSSINESNLPTAEARLGSPYSAAISGERRWSGGLREMPAYWLPNVWPIEDPARLHEILTAQQNIADELEGQRIDLSASEEDIRTALKNIERKLPSVRWELMPPFENEDRSEIEDPVERMRKTRTLVFSDVDGTLTSSEPESEIEPFVASYMQMAERCSGEVVLTSSRAKGNLAELKHKYNMSELAPTIFENGAGITFPVGMVSEQQIKEAAETVGAKVFQTSVKDGELTIELSEPGEALKERFEVIAREAGIKADFVLDMSAEQVMQVYHCSAETAEKILSGHPSEKKYFMHNLVFDEASEEQIRDIQERASLAGLHLTRAKLSWHLTSEGVHKGKAVLLVQELMRTISPEYQRSVAFGDAPNDFEMFQSCDESFMVGERDTMEVPANTHLPLQTGPDGVAEGFRKLFLK